MNLATKKCKSCGELLPLGALSKMRSGKYGVDSRCKSCRNTAARTVFAVRTDLDQRYAERDAARQEEIARRQAEGKVCGSCGTHKPSTAFSKNVSRFDGLADAYKSCHADRCAAWKVKNSDKARATAAAQNHRPERRAAKIARKRAHTMLHGVSRTEHYWHFMQWRERGTQHFFDIFDPRDGHIQAFEKAALAALEGLFYVLRVRNAHDAHVRRWRCATRR